MLAVKSELQEKILMKHWQVYWKLCIKLFSSTPFWKYILENSGATTLHTKKMRQESDSSLDMCSFFLLSKRTDSSRPGATEDSKKAFLTSVWTLPLLSTDLNYWYLSRPKKQWTCLSLKNTFMVLHNNWLNDQCSYQCFYFFQGKSNPKNFEFLLLFSQKDTKCNCFSTTC